MIDSEGYRANICIVICNTKKQVLWCCRVGKKKGWQFPQGGLKQNESEQEGLYRELLEELGLNPDQVAIIAQTKSWLKYDLPKKYQRRDKKPLCIGQKQKWFLLQLTTEESHINFNHTAHPEFSEWKWVSYTHPLTEVISFKRDVYQQALAELEPFLP